MIVQATHTATQTQEPSPTASTDPRTRAKARMRAAASKPRPAATPTPVERLKNFDHTTVVDFVKRHPLATAAGVGAVATMIGPIRLVRVGMAAFRTVSLATGVVTFLGSLGVPEAQEAVEAATPRRKASTSPRKRTSNTAKRNGSKPKPTATRKKASRTAKTS
jgi:hypothetical protein